VPASGTQPAWAQLRRRVLLSIPCFALVLVALVVARPLLASALAGAADGLGRTTPSLLLLAALFFAAAPACCGLAWREAILHAGGRVGRIDACARYGVGSLVNAIAPAHLGDVVRAVLLLERLPAGTRRGIVRWFSVIQCARIAALVALGVAAILPAPLVPLALVSAGALVLVLGRGRRRLVCFAFLAPLAKAAAIAVVLVGLDVGSPVDALAVVPALELAALVPLTPGNVGVAGAAAAGALLAQGLPLSAAVQAGLVLHAVETAAGLAYGTTSALAWLAGLGRGRSLAPRRVRAAVARAAPTRRVASEARSHA
jgi:uncharacterized membrane protein YbhN (UPF0104 family)